MEYSKMESRSSKCFHNFTDMSICMLNGSPCDDGYNSKPCECFLDKASRPSPDHIFDLKTGKWKLRNKQISVTSVE